MTDNATKHAQARERYANPQAHPALDQFVATIAALRAPDGCPWDREQTHSSIAHNMIEEAYEAVDAIEADDIAHLREELGDVLLQVVLQSQIAADAGRFTFDDVAADVNEKMVRRHPHIFGDGEAENASEVFDLWDKVKMAERKASADKAASASGSGSAASDAALAASDAASAPAPVPGLLDGVPTSFPALMQAQKISRKAAAAGFEWETLDDVWAQVESEVGELTEAYERAPKAENGKVDGDGAFAAQVEEEFGDVLFSLVNVARRMGIDSENALRASCRKFRRRWAFMEAAATHEGQRIEDLSTARQNELWKAAKRRENQ